MAWRDRVRRLIGPSQGAATGIAAVTGDNVAGPVASIGGIGGSVLRSAINEDVNGEGTRAERRARRRERRAAR